MSIDKKDRWLPTDSAERKNIPMATGLLDYFPAALAYVAMISKYGNDKHNPGEPLHHARGKSMDHADCIMRHLTERGKFDGKFRESGFMAWRALALLEEELETEEGYPLARGAREPEGAKAQPPYTEYLADNFDEKCPETRGRPDFYTCTLRKEHPGDHVATAGYRGAFLTSWPQRVGHDG